MFIEVTRRDESFTLKKKKKSNYLKGNVGQGFRSDFLFLSLLLLHPYKYWEEEEEERSRSIQQEASATHLVLVVLFFFARPGLGCSVSSQEGKARIYLSVYKKAHVVTRFSGCRVTIQIKKERERELGRLNRREKAIWKGSQLLTEEFHPVIQLFVPLSFERF